VHFLRSETITLDIQLIPRVINGEEVKITADIPKLWKKRFEQFKNVFLGETENSRKCKILNPEVLDFELDSDSDELFARSDHFLIVQNNALGYLIKNHIHLFSW
jgi:hypothetical protein